MENNKDDRKNISSQDVLFSFMEANASEAEYLKQTAVSMNAENTQEFINWQDRLNAVSMQP